MLSLQSLYVGAALLGGMLLLVQVIMSVFGLGGHGDVDADAHDFGGDTDGAAWGMGGLSFRTVVAFLTFFGIGGWAAIDNGMGAWTSVGVAVISGTIAFWIIGLLLSQTHRLSSSGTVDIKNAIGAEARVYLTVPAERTDAGSVTVHVQGRSQQFKAVTRGRELKTGALCKVIGVAASDTLEVEPL